jgi:hypothetical protein
MNTYGEFSLVVKDLHAPADRLNFVNDCFSTTSLDDINEQEFLRVTGKL